MVKVVRKQHFFKQYKNLILGALWIIVGLSYFLVAKNDVFSIFSVFYPLLGVVYLVLYVFQKERNQEFIAWDEEQVVVSQWQYKSESYSFEDISKITVTKEHFIINSTAEGKGKSMELKGYSEKDMKLLRSRFSPELAL
ncbi:hypothetical protein [Salinimicrobium sp. GXAS 041]|uniref:hypothetical protein n=1 Tax=Salinimicrobium sp. GXAS 041 TaxID=3400806 RepID=UPI003C775B32